VRKSNEPLFWALFSAGGMTTAMLAPALIVITGLLLPAGMIDVEDAAELLANSLARLVILGVFVLALLHWANRFRHTIYDMQLSPLMPISVISYVVAIAGSLWGAKVLLG
jgi:fumarate reductase subunit D